MRQLFRAVCILAMAGSCFAADVQSVLARMDRDAPSFHALGSDVVMVTYTAVIQDRTTEKGHLQMQKLSPTDVRAVIAFTGAGQQRTVALLGSIVKIYYPQDKTYRQYDFGAQAALTNQYLLLGFGASGSELAKNYDVKLVGTETVDGQQTDKLELVPKDAHVRTSLSKVWLWIPVNAGYPVQQQFFDPPARGNWRLVTYTNIQLNPAIAGKLDWKLPKGAKKISD